MATRSAVRMLAAAALLCALTLAAYWPGVAMYDSVAQYGQALSGVYDDWHPPIMARVWALFGAHGGGAMLAVQVAGFWLGLGLIAAALAAIGRPRAAAAVLATGVWPPFLGWQVAILKDAQMLGAGLAAVGLVAWWRLRGARPPIAAMVLAGVLLAYATLLRANAIFATAPLAVLLIGRPARPLSQVAAVLGAIVAVIAVSPTINHDLLGAQPTGVERTQALYDLAAIAVATGDGGTGLPPEAIAALRAKRCVSPFFWDPLGEPDRCNDEMDTLRAMPVRALYTRWIGSILSHPIAYAGQRLRHLNSTDRWIVPWRWQGAAPPVESEPNRLGLDSPGAMGGTWQQAGGLLVELPTGWPVVWIAAALLLALAAWRRAPDPPVTLARALIASALTLEASFTALSIASDLRYHLWPMVMTGIAAALLADRRPSRRAVGIVGAVIAAGLVARVVLPIPPQSYAGMLRWPASA